MFHLCLKEKKQKLKVMDWKAMKGWKKPPTLVVNGLYPLLSKATMSERSMIMLLVIEYLIGMLTDDVASTMDGHWPAPGHLEDIIMMACMIAYKLSPDTRRIVGLVGEVFEEDNGGVASRTR